MFQNLLLGKLTLDAIPFHNLFAMGAGVFMVLGFVGVLTLLTVFKKWSYIWNEWVTSVDHKKIGIMYLILAFVISTLAIFP